jgi:NTE family protein
MGGLVGGSYASGMTPAELRELMRTTDWDLMFLSDSPFKYKTFRRKQDRRAYPAQIEFGLKGGFRMPPGLNPGQQIALMLDAIALPYHDLKLFDDLPTPFRCVATDLRTSEAIILDRGSLARAMRATMAIPGVFTPVEMPPWLLVDGGALNNIPGDVSRGMDADIVIAVNVGTDKPSDEQARTSMFSMLGQTINAMMAVGIRKGLASADIIIDPDLTGLDGMSWRRSGELIERGYKAADAQSAVLLKYALSEADYATFKAARVARRRVATAVPTHVVVSGVDKDEQAFLRRQFDRLVGQPVDANRIAEVIHDVAGTDRYEFLTYRLEDTPEGMALLVFARPKQYGPPFLALGLELNNIASNSFAVNLGSRITAYDTVGKGSEVRTDVVVGTRQLVSMEIYRPLGRSPLFVAPRGYFSRHPYNFFAGDRQIAEYRITRAGAGLDLGVSMGRRSELRVGFDVAHASADLRVGSEQLPEVSGQEQFARLQFTYDGQNSPLVPSGGSLIRARVYQYFAMPNVSSTTPGAQYSNPDRVTQGEAALSYFHKVHVADRVFVQTSGGTSFGEIPLLNGFSLGGPLRMSAYTNDALRGANYVLATGGYLKRTGRLPDVLGGNIYLGGWIEGGSAFDRWNDAEWKGDVAAGVVMESLLGPIFAGVSVGFDGKSRFYVAIGPIFR